MIDILETRRRLYAGIPDRIDVLESLIENKK